MFKLGKLSIKILAIFVLISIFFVYLSYSVLNTVVSNYTKTIEEEYKAIAVKNVQDIISIFEHEVSYLASLIVPLYTSKIEVNLQALKIDFSYIENKDTPFIGKNIHKEQIEPILSILKNQGEIYQGLYKFEDKVAFIFAGYYPKSKILIGRFIDDRFVLNLKGITSSKFLIKTSVDDNHILDTSLEKTFISDVFGTIPIFVKKSNENTLITTAKIPDILGKPVIDIHLFNKAPIYSLTKKVMLYLITIILFMLILFILIVFFVIRWKILRRIEEFIQYMKHLVNDESFSTRIPVANKRDEIDELADTINWLVDNIEEREEMLIEEKLLFETLSNSAPIAIFMFDKQIYYSNIEFHQIFGKISELEGLLNLLPETDRKTFMDILTKLKQGVSNQYQTEITLIRGYERKELLLSITVIIYKNTEMYLATAIDITKQKQAEKEIIQLIYTDTLTGLPNRNSLISKLKENIATSEIFEEKFALILIDIDNFKEINETFGHTIGDEIIKILSKRLENKIKEFGNVLLFRLGGDEFAILIKQLNDEKYIKYIITVLKDTIQKPILIEGKSFYITASSGIAIYPKDGKDEFTILRHADTALYKAKQLGKNQCIYFSKDIEKQLSEKVMIENIIKSKLENKGFLMYYQPIVDLKTQNIVALETLIRCPLENGEFLSPAKFIPVAEESHLITEIDKFIIEKTLENIPKIRQVLNEDFKIAINISTKSIHQNQFKIYLEDLLNKNKQLAKHFELEITERLFLDKLDENISFLNYIRKFGVYISIDDFGTGYSSLSYLKNLPVDVLKIDISFVRGLPEDKDDRSIVKAIQNIAEDFNLKTVAEGIETYEQYMFLKDLGCNYGQGYYFYKPMPLEELTNLIKK